MSLKRHPTYAEIRQTREKAHDANATACVERLKKASSQERRAARAYADEFVARVRRRRRLDRSLVVLDMDCFYAAAEMRDRPEWRRIPFAVEDKGILNTANYPARERGVKVLMATFEAKKCCPELVTTPIDYEKYRRISREMHPIIREYDPNFGLWVLDEIFLSMDDHLEKRKSYGVERRTVVINNTYKGACICEKESRKKLSRSSPFCSTCHQLIHGSLTFDSSLDDAVFELRLKIFLQTGLPCSAGIAANFSLAKVCSSQNKPFGQFRLENNVDVIDAFVAPLPVRKWPGIGSKSDRLLAKIDVVNVRDIEPNLTEISLLFNRTSAVLKSVLEASLGDGPTDVKELRGQNGRKSLTQERTFTPATGNMLKLKAILKDLCESLETLCLSEGIKGKTLTFRYRTVSFDLIAKSTSFDQRLASSSLFFAAAAKLLEADVVKERERGQVLRIRTMGVKVSNLVEVENDDSKSHIAHFFQRACVNNGNNEKDKNVAEGGIFEHFNYANHHTDEWKFTLRADDVSVAEKFPCPICNGPFDDLELLNEHLDSCLNQTEIKRLINEDAIPMTIRKPSKGGKRKKSVPSDDDLRKLRKIESFFCTS